MFPPLFKSLQLIEQSVCDSPSRLQSWVSVNQTFAYGRWRSARYTTIIIKSPPSCRDVTLCNGDEELIVPLLLLLVPFLHLHIIN